MTESELTKPNLRAPGLAMSGGGFRATLFHIGGLWRLNQIGLLMSLGRVTSVSGGSITSAHLALSWADLAFDADGEASNFEELVVKPLRSFCARNVDVRTIVGGIASPFHHPSELLAKRYDKYLFKGRTLRDLPASGDGPEFIIYGTNLETGVSVRFTREGIADYRLGSAAAPDLPIAKAVATSSAFPPVYIPMTLKLPLNAWQRGRYSDLYETKSLRQTMRLGDGGIYDNMGLERLWNDFSPVLVSDAGSPFGVQEVSFWTRMSQIARVVKTLNISVEQNRALRKRMLIRKFQQNKCQGAYWGIASEIANYGLEKAGCEPPILNDSNITRSMANIRTRINAFSDVEQERLINWGYAIADTAIRRYLLPGGAKVGKLPYPERSL